MKYHVPLSFDDQYEITGISTLYTSLGQVTIIFTNPDKLQRFYRAAERMMAAGGSKIGSVEMEAASMAELVKNLLEMDPSMAGAVTFLPDSDPLADQLLDSLSQFQPTT